MARAICQGRDSPAIAFQTWKERAACPRRPVSQRATSPALFPSPLTPVSVGKPSAALPQEEARPTPAYPPGGDSPLDLWQHGNDVGFAFDFVEKKEPAFEQVSFLTKSSAMRYTHGQDI